MTTQVFLQGLPLDEGYFAWPLYRGTEARPVILRGFGPRWDEYRRIVNGLKGAPAKLEIRGSKNAGGNRGQLRVTVPEVYVLRATRVNEVQVELECYDARLKLRQLVGDMDFNMSFGDGFLDGTEFTTYRQAIEAYCARFPLITARLRAGAFDSIPDRLLEKNAHLSALLSPDPLAYLCHRAGCDLVIGVDSKWYFASREDASAEWFAGYLAYKWKVRPGFLALESIVTQRPRTIIPYYWEHHCIRAEGGDPASTVSSYGPETTRIELAQVYLYQGEYFSLSELLEELGFGGTSLTDAQIAKSFFSDSADGSPLHPVDTFQRKLLWSIIRRDWRRLWRIEFPSGNTGGWDQWRFGKLNADGSVTPVSVECKYIEFTRVVNPATGATIEGSPWSFNREAPSPFKAVWDDGPESGVIRIVVDSAREGETDAYPPMPGWLVVPRKGAGFNASGVATSGGDYDNALRIIGKDQLDNGNGETAKSLNLTLFGRESISKAGMVATFNIVVYLTARRFMPNNKTRWHAGSAVGFADGDIDQVELPPSEEVMAYRTYVGGDAPAVRSDGLGALLNEEELTAEDERRAEVWRLEHAAAVTGDGEADTLELATKPRLVDGPVQEAALIVNGVETSTSISVGNLGDERVRRMIADKRIAARGVSVQGRNG